MIGVILCLVVIVIVLLIVIMNNKRNSETSLLDGEEQRKAIKITNMFRTILTLITMIKTPYIQQETEIIDQELAQTITEAIQTLKTSWNIFQEVNSHLTLKEQLKSWQEETLEEDSTDLLVLLPKQQSVLKNALSILYDNEKIAPSNYLSNTENIITSYMPAMMPNMAAGASTSWSLGTEIEDKLNVQTSLSKTGLKYSTILVRDGKNVSTTKSLIEPDADFLLDIKMYDLNTIPKEDQVPEKLWKHAKYAMKFAGNTTKNSLIFNYGQVTVKQGFQLIENASKAQEETNSLSEPPKKRQRKSKN